MVTKRDTAPPAVDDDKDDAPPADTGVDEGAIRKVVGEMLESLGITKDDGSDPADAAEGKTPRTQAAVEADVESKVRAEIAKLRDEEDRDRRLEMLESKVAEPERSPVKERASTRVMGWGRKRQ